MIILLTNPLTPERKKQRTHSLESEFPLFCIPQKISTTFFVWKIKVSKQGVDSVLARKKKKKGTLGSLPCLIVFFVFVFVFNGINPILLLLIQRKGRWGFEPSRQVQRVQVAYHLAVTPFDSQIVCASSLSLLSKEPGLVFLTFGPNHW